MQGEGRGGAELTTPNGSYVVPEKKLIGNIFFFTFPPNFPQGGDQQNI